jgi:hypothetical protein
VCETRGTRGSILLQSPCNLAKAARARQLTWRRVSRGGIGGEGGGGGGGGGAGGFAVLIRARFCACTYLLLTWPRSAACSRYSEPPRARSRCPDPTRTGSHCPDPARTCSCCPDPAHAHLFVPSWEALWPHLLITQVFGPINEVSPSHVTTLFSDNHSAIALVKDHQYHARTKHIDIRFHFICWVIEDEKLVLIFCPTGKMFTNTLTKALLGPRKLPNM